MASICEFHALVARRPFSLAMYMLIVFGFSWPFQITGALWAHDLPSRYLLNSIAMLMVCIATAVSRKFVFRTEFANAGWSLGKSKHYLGILALVCFVWVVPTLIELGMGMSTLPTRIGTDKVKWIAVLLFGTLIPSFGEEFGWRGYLLPQLAQRMSARKAVFVHSVIWWVWHWPALIGAASQLDDSMATIVLALITSALPTLLHGIVIAWIWSQTQSLAIPTAYHALYDGVRDSLAITLGVSALVGTCAMFSLSLLGVFLLWRGKWHALDLIRRNAS